MEKPSVFGASPDTSDLAIATSVAQQLEIKSGLGEIGLVDLDRLNLREGLPPSVIGSVRRRIESAMARASGLLLDNEVEMVRIVDGIVGPRSSFTMSAGRSIH